MKILKFGGSSVASAGNIQKVLAIIEAAAKNRQDLVVVVSALGGITDNLIEAAGLAAQRQAIYRLLFKKICTQHNRVIKELIPAKNRPKVLAAAKQKYRELGAALEGIWLLQELSPRSLDTIMSFGEQLSAYIIGQAISGQGRACHFIDARELIKTDHNFGAANVDLAKTYQLITSYFKTRAKLSIMGGFIASTPDGLTTTLGRGGSDYTAALMSAALRAVVIEIWTDVDGVLTADPRLVKDASPLLNISYEEAGELAHFGAKVIHPKTMKPARQRAIPIHIKNTFNPDGAGTIISNDQSNHDFPIKGISSLDRVCLVRVQSANGKDIVEVAAKLFDSLARGGIEVLLITQASHEQSISIVVNDKQAAAAKSAIEKAFTLELRTKEMLPILIEKNLSIVAIIGQQMRGVPGIAGRFFSTLGDNKINIVAIAQGSSELNVSAVVASKDETKALQVVHSAFFKLTKRQPINLFLVGTGLIGSALLQQIQQSPAAIRIVGLANNRNMTFDAAGITTQNWAAKLNRARPMRLPEFVQRIFELNLPRSIFVDCTASEEVASVYEKLLAGGVAIVTPNKKANSGPLANYLKLKNLANAHQALFIYDTNVGAGLPILQTLRGLVASGDQILKIEAVLSGSLSYIFNTFSTSSTPFSQIVKAAQAKGYTEPDPRDDLAGLDVARKILIIARETGQAMEPRQVKVEPFLPARCFRVGSPSQFFAELAKSDADLEKKKLAAQKKGQVLRFVATLKNSQAKVSLQGVGSDHPFYNLSGSDNIVSIATKRYNSTPLVIKGPGAGAQVTAGGVLANILGVYK